MPRSVNNVAHKARKKKYLKAAKGYYGRKSKLFKTAKEAVMRGWQYAYRDRRQRHPCRYLPCFRCRGSTCQQNRVCYPSDTYRNQYYRAVSK